MRRRTGLSLVEVLVSAIIMMLAVGVVARAFSAGLMFEQKSTRHRTETAERLWLEDQVYRVVSGATLKPTNAYFVSPIPLSVNTPGLSSSRSGNIGPGSDSLVLTNSSLALPIRAATGKAKDFESVNRQFGPMGGTTEAALSLSAIGDSKGQKGLFLREQCPADSDNQRGGEEQVLGPSVKEARFQFYDGTRWQDTWDTAGADKGKLPKLVRFRYLVSDEREPREILIRLPLADASANPTTPSGNQPPNGTPTGPQGGPSNAAPQGGQP